MNWRLPTRALAGGLGLAVGRPASAAPSLPQMATTAGSPTHRGKHRQAAGLAEQATDVGAVTLLVLRSTGGRSAPLRQRVIIIG
jgi:hypothetical protein